MRAGIKGVIKTDSGLCDFIDIGRFDDVTGGRVLGIRVTAGVAAPVVCEEEDDIGLGFSREEGGGGCM